MFKILQFSIVLRAFLVVLGVLFSLSAVASSKEPRWFEIELVIFENNESRWMNSEQWPEDPQIPVFDDAMELSSQEPLMVKRLEGVARSIAASPKYELLMHTGWREAVKSRSEAVGVRLAATSQQGSELDGVVKVSVERYLHINIDFIYRKQQDYYAHEQAQMPQTLFLEADQSSMDLFPSSYGMKSYVIKSKRRVRSKELHYFDHPLVAMLILITPYKEPDVVDKAPQEKMAAPVVMQPDSQETPTNSGKIIR